MRNTVHLVTATAWTGVRCSPLPAARGAVRRALPTPLRRDRPGRAAAPGDAAARGAATCQRRARGAARRTPAGRRLRRAVYSATHHIALCQVPPRGPPRSGSYPPRTTCCYRTGTGAGSSWTPPGSASAGKRRPGDLPRSTGGGRARGRSGDRVLRIAPFTTLRAAERDALLTEATARFGAIYPYAGCDRVLDERRSPTAPAA
jgi:hypothetical protein